MCRLIDDISGFLAARGFECSVQNREGFYVISVKALNGIGSKTIMPIELSATTLEQAVEDSNRVWNVVQRLGRSEGYPIIIPEDRWHRHRGMMEARVLAHMEVHSQAYARNCEVRRIDKEAARKFLEDNHAYGYALCKYQYGLFLKRHTGHIARQMCERGKVDGSVPNDNVGELIAVATFSKARKWIKDGKEIRSYEWVRSASLPGMRVSGGMGKLLRAFIKDVQPDDIMSYADLEWSEGEVYKALGFMEESLKSPVCFEVDSASWERHPIRNRSTDNISPADCRYYANLGGVKFRLKLTQYQ